MKRFALLACLLTAMMVAASACGPRAFTKGDYDDPENKNLLDDQFSESDMQHMVKKLADSLIAHPAIAKATKPPTVMVTRLENKTSEHIDTQSISDMLKVELMKSGKAVFVDKEARGDVADEYDYQNSGMMEEKSKKGKGKQVGADFILNGRLDSIVKEVGKDKTVYYKITLNLTNLSTNLTVWTDQDQIRKLFKKRSVTM